MVRADGFRARIRTGKDPGKLPKKNEHTQCENEEVNGDEAEEAG